MGRKRFYIIVDGQYCHEAMKILRDKKLYAANVVITDKLPDSEVTKGSAAEQLVIPNVYARRYANYLLNGIHLCDSLEELHEYPKGGLTKDGMLAKSYSVACMNMKNTQICMGQDAIEVQKKAILAQKNGKQQEWRETLDELEKTNTKRNSLKSIDFVLEDYRLEAPELLSESCAEKKRYEDNVKQIKENPEFLSVLQEQLMMKLRKRIPRLTGRSGLQTMNGRQKRADKKTLPARFIVRKVHTMKSECYIWSWKSQCWKNMRNCMQNGVK